MMEKFYGKKKDKKLKKGKIIIEIKEEKLTGLHWINLGIMLYLLIKSGVNIIFFNFKK